MPSFGPSAQDSDSRGSSTSRLINCYRQPVMGEGRTRFLLKSVLGTSAHADVGAVFLGGSGEFENDIYATYDGTLYRIGTGGAVNSVGAVVAGAAYMSSNNGWLTMASGGAYYAIMGTITTPTVNPFSSVADVAFQDQYTLLIEKDGRRWAWSDLADPTTIPGLNFATAEATDNDLLRIESINGRVVLFKEQSREIWYNTGQSGADAFSRVSGGVRNTGLKSASLMTKTDSALFWVGNDNIARLSVDGVTAQKFSYPPVDTAVAQGTPTECFYYEDEGQKFCVIRFSDRASWVLDLGTAEWHERAEGASHDPWSIRNAHRIGSTWYGLTDDGLVRTLTRNNADAGTVLKRTAVSPTFYVEEGATLDELEIYARTGFHTLGRDAQMWIRISRDGGHTWTLEKWRSLGGIGDFREKATWLAQGDFERLTIEASISEPAEIPLWSDFRLEMS